MNARLKLIGSLILLSSPSAALADFWSDVGRVITAPITLPTETTIQVLRRDDPAEPVRNAAGAAGSVVQQTTDVTQRVHNVIMNVPRDAVRTNLGNDWLTAYDSMTGAQRVQAEMGFTSGRFLGGCLQGQNCSVNQFVALPLAASLRDAYKVYIGQSHPLDPGSAALLSRVMPMNVVLNARLAYGATPDMTIPGFLNAGYELAGGGHAVTIGNLMIFSRPLNSSDQYDWLWLLHELRHSEQYARQSANVLESVDGFAVEYTQYANSLETDAENTAAQRLQQLRYICQWGC
jgi:hypothetical protein